jgi:hypothetical protein
MINYMVNYRILTYLRSSKKSVVIIFYKQTLKVPHRVMQTDP